MTIQMAIMLFVTIICAHVSAVFMRKYEKTEKKIHLVIFAACMMIGLSLGTLFTLAFFSLIITYIR